MLPEKTNISARVEITLKKIVEDSTFTHKDAYELGAKLIAMGNAEETIALINTNELGAKLIAMGNAEDTLALINTNPDFERIIKQTEYRLIEARKQELERELKDL